MQSCVAVLALASLMVMIAHHHRREGGLLTQPQEEMILMGAFGLFWIALLIGFRAYRQPGPTGVGGSSNRGSNRDRGGDAAGGGKLPYPCSGDSAYCIVEEWSYY